MLVLGLDISSTKTGWALLDGPRLAQAGAITTNRKDSLAERLAAFREQLAEVLEVLRPDAVAIEDVYIRHKSAVVVLARFSGVALELCGTAGLPCDVVTATHVRKALGLPNRKESVFDAMVERFELAPLGWAFATHNDVTDAVAVASASQQST